MLLLRESCQARKGGSRQKKLGPGGTGYEQWKCGFAGGELPHRPNSSPTLRTVPLSDITGGATVGKPQDNQSPTSDPPPARIASLKNNATN